MGPKTFSSVDELTKSIGGASFLTEWGGVYFTPPLGVADNSTFVEETLWIMDEADARFQSWTHWDIDYFLNVPSDDAGGFLGCQESHARGCIKYFIRPYAQAIAGTPITMRFDHSNSGNFTLEFAPDASIAAPTEIFLPPFRYPHGFDVAVEPADAPFSWSACEGQENKLCVSAKANTLPTSVTITISPKAAVH